MLNFGFLSLTVLPTFNLYYKYKTYAIYHLCVICETVIHIFLDILSKTVNTKSYHNDSVINKKRSKILKFFVLQVTFFS